MEMTVNIDDTVAHRLRDEAGRRETTVSAFIEATLRRVLPPMDGPAGEPDRLPPLPKWDSGGHLVNIDNREELYRAMGDGEGYGSVDEG